MPDAGVLVIRVLWQERYHKWRALSLAEISEDVTSALSNQLLRFSVTAQIDLLSFFRPTFPIWGAFLHEKY